MTKRKRNASGGKLLRLSGLGEAGIGDCKPVWNGKN